MLAEVTLPMKCALQFALCLTHTGLRRASAPALRRKLFAAILVCAGMTSQLLAQSSVPTPAADQSASATLPAAPSPVAAAPKLFSTPSAPIPALDPFQPSLGNFAGSTAGAGRQSVGGFNQMGGSGINGRQGNFAPLFPAKDSPTRGAGGPFGSAPATPPSLNQLMRGSSNLPLISSPSSFRFTYQEALRPGGALGDLGRPTASAMFTTSDLGNGVFLSAGPGYGARSMAGAPAAGLGNGTAGEHKPSGPSVNLRLSF
jgi:hypothetical protein